MSYALKTAPRSRSTGGSLVVRVSTIEGMPGTPLTGGQLAGSIRVHEKFSRNPRSRMAAASIVPPTPVRPVLRDRRFRDAGRAPAARRQGPGRLHFLRRSSPVPRIRTGGTRAVRDLGRPHRAGTQGSPPQQPLLELAARERGEPGASPRAVGIRPQPKPSRPRSRRPARSVSQT